MLKLTSDNRDRQTDYTAGGWLKVDRQTNKIDKPVGDVAHDCYIQQPSCRQTQRCRQPHTHCLTIRVTYSLQRRKTTSIKTHRRTDRQTQTDRQTNNKER